MAEISAASVKALREKTGLPMMDCKRALGESNGDIQKAIELLRKAGVKVAEKQAGRATRGVHLMDIKEGDKVASIARIAAAELKKVGVNPNGETPDGPGKQFELPIK